MKLTKLLALLLALTLVFTLAACGNSNNDDPSGNQQGTNLLPSWWTLILEK